ncbi:hypothetical protein XNC1_2018 [Xenorhabdus nematophila ATCC 19061]|uniref:Transposase n=2 Tax=Xenorhabdus nematophila TaxID=628 RepID=D3VE11_XENNA|nr:hypothetical protein XNC1_2018 [Xenorhabdus nematophila ATCC 19061]
MPPELMHNTTRDSRVCDRIKAGLLAHEGWTAQRIARALRIHDSTVSRHLKDFLAQEKLPRKMAALKAISLPNTPLN